MMMERAQNVSSISFDQESKIPSKNKLEQEIKNEPLELDEVHEGSNDDVIKRVEDVSNISFDHEDKIPIKIEFKQEIKSEPLDKVERSVHEGFNK